MDFVLKLMYLKYTIEKVEQETGDVPALAIIHQVGILLTHFDLF